MTGDWHGSPTAVSAVIDCLWRKTIACLRDRGLKVVQQLRAVIGCCKKYNRLSEDRGLTTVQQQCAVIETCEQVRDTKYNRLSGRQGTGVQQLPLAVIVGTTLGLGPDCRWLAGHCHHLSFMLPHTTSNLVSSLASQYIFPCQKQYNHIPNATK